MSNPTKEINSILHLKCKECLIYKQLGSENWYRHSQGYLGVLGRCKECIKNGRKTNKELSMARIRDTKRYNNNKNRRKYIYESSKERRKTKGYSSIHKALYRRIKFLGIRPNICSVCNLFNKRIEAHHFNYQYPWKVIFCCKICHCKLDRGKIDWRSYKIFDVQPLHITSSITGIDHKINNTGSVY